MVNATNDITVNSVVADNGSGQVGLTKTGAGTLTLAGVNTYAGTTTINSGTLQINGTLGAGNVVNNGALLLNGSFVSNAISGSGSVISTGTTNLLGANTHSGGTQISSGSLTVNSTSLGTGAVANNGMLNIYTSGPAVSNVISGSGAVTTLGSGMVVLTGNNTYTGGTSISPVDPRIPNQQFGTLQIGNGGTSGTLGSGDVANNGTLAFKRSDGITVSNAIRGTGALSQLGLGILTLSGANTYTGGTTINSGTVAARSASALGAGFVTTNSGGTLDAVGTALTAGDLTFNAGSVFKIDGHTRINATSLTIVPGAKISAATTGFVLGQQVPIITTTGAVSGSTFDTTPSETAPAGYRWVSANDGKNAYMGLQLDQLVDPTTPIPTEPAPTAPTPKEPTPVRPSPVPAPRLTRQQQAIATALDRSTSSISVNGDIQRVYEKLHDSGQNMGADLQQLSGNDRATDEALVRQLVCRNTDILQMAHLSLTGGSVRFADAGQSSYDHGRSSALSEVLAMAAAENPGAMRLFAYGEHAKGSKQMSGGSEGSTRLTANAFTAGFNKQWDENWSMGATFDYDEVNTTALSGLGRLEAKSYGGSVFGAHTFDEDQDLFIAATAGASYATYEGERQSLVGPASGNCGGTHLWAAMEVGYKIALRKDMSLTPVAGLSYVRSHMKAAQETLPDAPGLALAYDKQIIDRLEALVGAEWTQTVVLGEGLTLSPLVRVLWHHQLHDLEGQTVATHFAGDPSTLFNTYQQAPAVDSLEVDAGASAQLDSQWNLFLQGRYFQELGSGAGHQYGIGGGISYSF